MRKIYAILFLLPFSVLAQNYRSIDTARETYFEFNHYTGEKRYVSIRIDTATVTGTDTNFYHYRIFDSENVWGSCIDVHDTSWMGYKTVIQTNGLNVFFNQELDSIRLNTLAGLNSTWTMFSMQNGDYIEATVTGETIENIPVGVDSIKIISLQAKNSSNVNISHMVNGKNIKLSKNNGLTEFLNFFLFPSDTTTIRISGKQNPDTGITNLSAHEVFDFDIGDVFHYRGGYNNLSTAQIFYIQKNVLGKYLSANMDTLRYTYDRMFYSKSYTFSPYDSTFFFIHDTLSDSIIFSRNTFFQKSPWEFYTNQNEPTGFAFMVTDSADYNGRLMKTSVPFFNYDSINDCADAYVGWCIYYVYTYAKGLGNVSVIDNTSFTCGHENMIYFQKGTETWGTPLNWSVILGTGPEMKKDFFTVAPNPFADFISINFTNNISQKVTVTLVNRLGQSVYNRTFENQNPIEFSTTDISQGAYILSLSDGKKIFNYKLIK